MGAPESLFSLLLVSLHKDAGESGRATTVRTKRSTRPTAGNDLHPPSPSFRLHSAFLRNSSAKAKRNLFPISATPCSPISSTSTTAVFTPPSSKQDDSNSHLAPTPKCFHCNAPTSTLNLYRIGRDQSNEG